MGVFIFWKWVIVEGYVILNKDVKVVYLIEVKIDLMDEDIVVYVWLVENIFYLFIFYVEYSGMYGDLEVVRKVSVVLSNIKFWYGGGICLKE